MARKYEDPDKQSQFHLFYQKPSDPRWFLSDWGYTKDECRLLLNGSTQADWDSGNFTNEFLGKTIAFRRKQFPDCNFRIDTWPMTGDQPNA